MLVVLQISALKEHITKMRFDKIDFNTEDLSTKVNNKLRSIFILESDLLI